MLTSRERPSSTGAVLWLRSRLLLLLLLLASPGLALAQTSTFCPTLSAIVPYGGSVSINAGACHVGFGLGVVLVAPTHGTATIGEFGANQTINYSHNGSSGTSDSFVVNDGEAPPNNRILVNITITPPTSAITVAPASLPALTAGTPFSQTLTSTGGVGPYTYSLQSGPLPVGLSLTSGGVLSGTPTQRGTYTFSVRSQDSIGDFVVKGYTGSVQTPTLSLVPSSAGAIQNVPFSLSLGVNGGVAPHSFLHEVVGGALPPGISLSSTGVLSGTPTTLGTTNFQIRVTDSSTGPGSYFEVENYSFTVSPPPSVSIAVSPPPVSVSEDGSTNLTYTVTRSTSLATATTVNLGTTGTATSGVDYTGGVASVVIPAGQTTAQVVIDPTTDGTVEPDETVILTVAAGTGYTVGGPSSATGTILNDDVPTATIGVSPAAVAEDGVPNLVYTVTLNQAPLAATSVNFTRTGSGTAGSDFPAPTSPLVIPAGNTSGTIVVDPTGDTVIEADETVTLTLAAGAGYTVGVPNSATGTILNDDLPNLSINDVTINEGNAGTTNFTFTVSLSVPAGPGGVTFDIATANGTATAGSDYVANSLTGQTIPAGSSTYTFTVQANGDALNEPSETFFANVTNVVNAVLADGQGQGTIVNDDPLPNITIANTAQVEGNGGTSTAQFAVFLNTASGQAVSVNYATADGTATAPGDYTSTSGTLIFAPGELAKSVDVPVIGETAPEADETFFVNLSGATNATIADNQGVGTITNDDVPVTVSPGTLPNGTVAAAYSQSLSASGGTAPYTFAVTAGALPAGLSLSGGGLISGTPTAGGSFNFTVTATDNSAAPGPYSGSQAYTLVVDSILPGAPTIGTATAGDGEATITFTAPTNDGGSAITGYTVTSSPGGFTGTGAGSPITVTGLTNGLAYTFTVTATNGVGTGPASAASNSVTPKAPQTITFANPGAQSFGTSPDLSILGGGASSTSGLAVTFTSSTTGVCDITPGGALTFNAAGTCTINADQAGNAEFLPAPQVSRSFTVVPVVPDAPTAVVAIAGDTQASVAFVAPANTGGTSITGYTVTTFPADVAPVNGAGSPIVINGLTNGQAYTFTVTADNSAGTGPASAASNSITPKATQTITFANPGAQNFGTTPTLSATSDSGLTPVFTSSTVGVCTITSGGALTFVTAGTCTINADQPGDAAYLPAPQVTRSFTVAAVVPGAPTAVTAVAGNARATVDFVAPAFTGGSAITGYTVTSSPGGFTGTGAAGPITVTGLTNGQAYTFTVTATNGVGDGAASSASNSVTPLAPVITITPPTLADATVGVAYSQAFASSGGVGPYTYSLAAGALPAGMSLTSGGVFSGTPTAAGTFNFTVTSTDSNGDGSSQAFSLTVLAPTIALAPATLADGTVGVAYAQAITASGGTGPYTYSILSGALPVGMSFSSAGDLSGTPTGAGTYNFSIVATDSFGSTGLQAFALTVNAPTLALTPGASAFNAAYDAAFSQAFTASGGTGPYTYALTGTLPAGLAFAGNTLSGTATEPGSYAFTVTATDSSTGTGAPFSVATDYTLDVAAPTIVITPATLPGGTANSPYTALLTASGGSAPYSFWIVDPANFPAGMTFDGGGNVGGTPTTAGSYTFTVEVADQYAQGTQQTYTLVIAVEAPTAGDVSATVAYGSSANVIAPVLGGGTATSVAIAGAASNGTATATGTGLAYTPNPGFAGVDAFTYTATNASGTSAPATVTVTVSDPTLAIADGGPANGTAGVAYSRTFSASGGAAPYTLGVTGLPAGLSVTASTADTITVSGTPTVAGSFTLTVSGNDSSTGTGPFNVSQTFPLTLAAPTLTLAPATLADGIAGTAYSADFSTTGGTAPYVYAVTAGTLPAGLGLAAGGTLSGTLTTPGTSNFTVTSTDALGFSTSLAYTLTVDASAPVAVADSASTLAGQAVAIAVTANDTGDFGSIAVASAPANGTAVVSGLEVTYTPAAGFSGTDSFTYTATGPGGTSAPATVTVTVNPLPVAAAFDVTTTPGTPVQVLLTQGATGGPFTGADIVSVTPASSGTAAITSTAAGYLLTYTPNADFSGPVVVQFTLDNAFATSAVSTVNISVEDRPDPSQDAEVQGLVDAQAESTRRFATGQIGNFQRRLEALHRGGSGGVSNGIGFAIDRPCIEPLVGRTIDPCGDNPLAEGAGNGLTAADGQGRSSDDGNGPVGLWTGGMIRSGSQDGRDGNADISFETDGLSTGVDYRVNEALVVGGGFGYGRDENEVGGNGSRVDGSARTVALYASWHPGEMFFLDSVLGYQQLDFDLRRYVTATGGLVSGQRDGDQWFASVSVGADIVRNDLLLTPYGRIDIARATLDAYAETGDAIYALRYDAMDVDSDTGTLGLRLAHPTQMNWGRLTPQLRLEYQRDLGGRSEAGLRYADLPGGPRYGLLATDFDRNRFALGLGALVDLDSGWSWRVEYQSQIGDSVDHGMSVNIQKQF